MKYHSLKRNNDFARGYRFGKNSVSPCLVLYVNKNRVKKTRIGITTSKKVGNAVKRNRARRVIRQAIYDCNINKNLGKDLIFVARGQTPFKKSYEITKSMKKLLENAGIQND